MKFLHTADWQIGMKAQSLGEAGVRVREERIAASKRVVDAAKAHGVEFIVITGDVFEDNAVERVLVQRIADILATFEGPVFIIPGNHDPLTPGSVWEHPAWKSAETIRILREPTPVNLNGATLYPCPAREKHSGADPTAWIPQDQRRGIRIGLAHGTVEGIRQDEPDYPIARNAAQRSCLDYLALGHWHSYATYQGQDGTPHMAYSGTHETTKFGERDSGNALIVEIAAAGSHPLITPVQTGGLRWVRIEKGLRDRGDLKRAREEIEAMQSADAVLIDVRLSGVLMAEEQAEIERIQEILASRFLYGNLDFSGLLPSPEDDRWVSDLPAGMLQEAASRLRAQTNTPGPQSEVAARALMELYSIAGEVVR